MINSDLQNDPILVRSLHGGIPFTFALADLENTDEKMDILLVSGSTETISPLRAIWNRITKGDENKKNVLLKDINEPSSVIKQLNWESPTVGNSNESKGKLFNQLWAFTNNQKFTETNRLYRQLYRSIELIHNRSQTEYTLWMPLVGYLAESKQNQIEGLNLRWQFMLSLLAELSDSLKEKSKLEKIVIYTYKEKTLRLMNKKAEIYPPVCLNIQSDILKSIQEAFVLIPISQPISMYLRKMLHQSEATFDYCSKYKNDQSKITDSIAELCANYANNSRIIIEHISYLFYYCFADECEISEFKNVKTLFEKYKAIESFLEKKKKNPQAEVSLNWIESWKEIVSIAHDIRIKTNPVVHMNSLWEISRLHLYSDLLCPLVKVISKCSKLKIFEKEKKNFELPNSPQGSPSTKKKEQIVVKSIQCKFELKFGTCKMNNCIYTHQG